MAKLLKTDHSRTSTTIRGTRGYFAPEWFKSMMITAKVDVYSYGVMLMEIICCRKNIVLEQQNYDEAILTVWAYDCYKNGRLDMLVDHEEEALNDTGKLNRLVMVAIWCIQEEPSLRPSMKKGRQIGLCGKEINRMGCSDPDLSTVRSTSVELDVSAFVCTVTPLVWSGSQSQRCYC
ncbi:hypothetical protein AAC387_Pa03g4005 [Persea americana]